MLTGPLVGGAAIPCGKTADDGGAAFPCGRIADDGPEIVDALEGCTEHEEWVRLDAAFHVALADATGNQVQARLVEHLRDLLIEQSNVVAAVKGRIPRANAEHRAIYEAVAVGDERAARKVMSTHLLNAYRN